MVGPDLINIICSIASLGATVAIAILQLRQSHRMEIFEHRLDRRDEQRRAEKVKSQAVSFISKHYADINLIPLCAIAAMYNDLYYYSREMYREFCCLTHEVQNLILEYCELDLRIKDEKELFHRCIAEVNKVIHDNFSNDEPLYISGGKNVLRCLESYGSEKIPIEYIEYNSEYMNSKFTEMYAPWYNQEQSNKQPYNRCITDVLSASFRGEGTEHPIQDLKSRYKNLNNQEINRCQFETVIAQYIAIYGDKDIDSDKEYGTPEAYRIDKMEDLFLLAVFEMYTHLVLKEK